MAGYETILLFAVTTGASGYTAYSSAQTQKQTLERQAFQADVESTTEQIKRVRDAREVLASQKALAYAKGGGLTGSAGAHYKSTLRLAFQNIDRAKFRSGDALRSQAGSISPLTQGLVGAAAGAASAPGALDLLKKFTKD